MPVGMSATTGTLPWMKQPAPPDPITQAYNLYNKGVEQQAGDYGNIMKNYGSLYGTIAEKGQYTPQQAADIRERGISPIRAIYAGANRDIDRQRALQGGYSPGYSAAKAKMARELSESLAAASTNVNAQLAQDMMKNQQTMNQQQMGTLQGQTGLYGTTPALAATFGGQALNEASLQEKIQARKNQQGLEAIGRGMQAPVGHTAYR